MLTFYIIAIIASFAAFVTYTMRLIRQGRIKVGHPVWVTLVLLGYACLWIITVPRMIYREWTWHRTKRTAR